MHVRLWTNYIIIATHVQACKKYIWMSNVTKVACRWFQVEEEVYIYSEIHDDNDDKKTKDTFLRLMLVIPNVYRRSFVPAWKNEDTQMPKSCV